jgi:hypothetical protein
MIDIKLFCQALKMTWIKKYIDSLNCSPWKIEKIFVYLLVYCQGGLAELLEFGLELAMQVT